MKCKKCKNEIPEGSLFCMYCGEKQIRTQADKRQLTIPPPVQLPSGSWRGRMTIKGKRVSITAPTERQYYAKAKEMKAEMQAEQDKRPPVTLRECCDSYLEKRRESMSPASFRFYSETYDKHFQKFMHQNIYDIDFQTLIDAEKTSSITGRKLSAKTIKNAYGALSPALKEYGVVPSVVLPKIPKQTRPYLTDKQIDVFLEEIKGRSWEIGALLALHGLRRSEVYAVTKKDIHDGKIHVEGTVVKSVDGFIYSDTNKTSAAVRDVPIMIDRLQELVDASESDLDKPLVTTHPNGLYGRINDACERRGLPKVGVHGLRRSFASLMYREGIGEHEAMRLGGWSDYQTMHNIYIQISDEENNEAAKKLRERFKNK